MKRAPSRVALDASATPGAWAFSRNLPKDSGQVRLVGEASLQGDLREWRPHRRDQLFGALNSRVSQPLMRRDAKRLLEGADEMGRRQPGQRRERRQIDTSGQICLDVVCGALSLPVRQAASAGGLRL
jgi:hypothetical protein